MLQVIGRKECNEIRWSQKGIWFQLVADENAFIIGQRILFENKDYLVTERGIAEARITAKSAADSKPLDTAKNARARAKNRRVDVIFVPEGATVPEDD
jgi:hypothetical protein